MKRCRHRLSEQLSQDRLPGSDDLPAANKADLGIATVEAVLVRRRREIAAWGHDPRRTGHKAFARLGEGLHANSRNAVDRYRHAVMRDHVSRDSIDLLSKHPWPGAKMAAQQRARRRIEKYELSLGRQAAPLDEEGPVRQGVRRLDEEKVVVAPICKPCQDRKKVVWEKRVSGSLDL